MPAPQASAMQQLAKQKFMSFGLVIPSDWKQPQGEKAKLYQDAFDSPDHNRPDTSNRLFQPASRFCSSASSRASSWASSVSK